MHFHGTQVQKPIPFYQIYKGTVFELVDQAVDFVMSKIDLWVGTRAESTQVPTAYEIPREAVSEAIVNAIAHRDYTSNGSVQVMLFSDRLEIWNPGTLPPQLTPAKLLQPHSSLPANPLLADPLYLNKYIEKAGSGTLDMAELCKAAGLSVPEFRMDSGGLVVTIRRKVAQVAAHGGIKSGLSGDQVEVLRKCMTPNAIGDLMAISGRTSRTKFRDQVLKPMLDMGLVEMTIPDKPRSSKQKYRVTDKGRALLKENSK